MAMAASLIGSVGSRVLFALACMVSLWLIYWLFRARR